MNQNKFGELVFNEADLFDLAMQGHDLTEIKNLIVDTTVDVGSLQQVVNNNEAISTWHPATDNSVSVQDYDAKNQANWHMPESYKNLDIAAYLLDLCKTDAQLQRVGQELLLYHEHGLFNLLQYLKYLVDTLRENNVIWGVGRGSSVASYVLYLLGVHKIDSLYYDLDPHEFLR